MWNHIDTAQQIDPRGSSGSGCTCESAVCGNEGDGRSEEKCIGSAVRKTRGEILHSHSSRLFSPFRR
uniref:Uncharacterized protein n=1 Tax=Gasterosteus aculeatus aculeatus TaxID=481459 RepID=A0AAQ4Q547_GASAC